MAVFYLFPEIKEIPRLYNVGYMARLLLISLMQIYYEKEQVEEKKNQKITVWREKKTNTKKFNVTAKASAEKSVIVKEIRGLLSVKLSTCKRIRSQRNWILKKLPGLKRLFTS